MRRAPRLACIAALFAATACGGGAAANPPAQTPTSSRGPAGATPSPQAPASTPPSPEKVDANELGMVPVLMYHRLGDNPGDVYTRTREEFRAELVRLAREGYVPVTAADYVAGDIDIPAGKHAVVLTFDDSTHDQFRLGASGKPRPDTAVGILHSVAEDYPDFQPVATFYVNQNPFAAPDRGRGALRWLREHGFEIGNHTYGHANLGELGADGVQRQLAKLDRMVHAKAPQAEVTTMALPLGVSSDEPELAAHGSWKGIKYDYSGVFLVGAGPAPSPHDEDFDPLAIPRVRSQGLTGPDADFCSTHWLDYLEKHPGKRYTSDGDPDRVSFPKGTRGELSGDFAGTANPY